MVKISKEQFNTVKWLAGKLVPALLFGSMIYLGLLILRVYGVALFTRTYVGPAQQIVILAYVLAMLLTARGYQQAFSDWGSWSINPLLKRKFLIYNGGAVAIVADHQLNDQHSGWGRPLFSVIYDVTFGLSVVSLLFLAAAILIFLILKYWSKKTSPVSEQPKEVHFRTEPSIGKQGKDKLNREEFAGHIARNIEKHAISANEGALTIGLFGPWGSGKTSIFDLMEKQLVESKSSTVILRFQPWFFGKDYMNLIPEFLIKLIDSIKVHSKGYDPGLIRDLQAYRKLLTPISLRPPGMIISLKDFPKNAEFSKDYTDADDMRIQIVERLKFAKIKLLVFIDDLDRLDNKEIQMVFKLVRMVADFPNTTYIIAMDEEIVVNSLAQMYSKEFARDVGKDYLEKFIQVPLYIPASDLELLGILGSELIEPILVAEKIELNQIHIRDILMQLEISPRNLQRLSNLLQIYLPLLKKEIYAMDLISLLAIKVVKPGLFEFILKHSDYFLGKLRNTDSQSEIRDKVRSLYSSYNKILGKMFPLMENNEFKKEWELQKRIGTPEHFWTYFMYSMPSNKLSESDMDTFYAALEEGGSEAELQEAHLINKTSSHVLHKKLQEKIAASEVSRNLLLYKYFVEKFNSSYDKEFYSNYNEGQTLISLFGFLYINTENQLNFDLLFYEKPTNLALLGRVYENYNNIAGLKQDIQSYLSLYFTYPLLRVHHEEDIRGIFRAWSETAQDDEKRKQIRVISAQYGLDSIISLLMTDYVEDNIKLLDTYVNVLEYVPISVINKGLSGLEHITSDKNMNQEFTKGSNRHLIILSYMHNTMYDFVLQTLTKIYNNSGTPEHKLSQTINRLCQLGDSVLIRDIRSIHDQIQLHNHNQEAQIDS